MNAAQKFAVIYFLIALVAVLIVTFTGSGFSFEALSGYLPYVALFAFVILWEVLLYYAHFFEPVCERFRRGHYSHSVQHISAFIT